MSVDDDQVFHVECFQCVACHHVLAPGQMFGMYEGLIYCQRDYQHIINYWRHSEDTDNNHQTTTHETLADTLENKEITEQTTEKNKKKSRSKSKNVLTKEQLNILKTCYMSVFSYLIFMLLSLNIQVQPETTQSIVQPVDGDDWTQLALPQSVVPE